MLREKYPPFAATKYLQPMDLSQNALKDDEWVISYDVSDPGLLIYLTKGKTLVNAWFKPVPRKEIDELARRFREPLEIREGRGMDRREMKTVILAYVPSNMWSPLIWPDHRLLT
ncbi:MAG: hypothetical protein ACLQPD_06790 [Desulfomonilaceae bacterium]